MHKSSTNSLHEQDLPDSKKLSGSDATLWWAAIEDDLQCFAIITSGFSYITSWQTTCFL
eukprot:c40745_g1_i1 orf=2-178(+)